MVESLDYEVLQKEGSFELRRYPLTILATVREKSDSDAFSILFGYISGDNSRREKVPMTAPVVSKDVGSERISMTVPVVSGNKSFSFVLPSRYSPTTVPKPSDPRVSIEVLPERQLAVLRFRGRAGARSVASHHMQLQESIRRFGLTSKGELFLMRYNPPFTPGFLRRNEVAVEVVSKRVA